MATGEKVPLVFFPRYTSFVGQQLFVTTPVDMMGFESITITTWRGPLTPAAGAPAFTFALEESADMDEWKDITPAGGPSWPTGTPTADTKVATPKRRYVRMTASPTGDADASTTAWAVGFAQRTQA